MDRQYYFQLLPDEILLEILNKVENRSKHLSLVNYQFYTVNRNFVTKCYHLQHLIKPVKNMLAIVNNKFPKICIFNFTDKVSLSIINTNYIFIPNKPANNIISLMEQLSDSLDYCQHYYHKFIDDFDNYSELNMFNYYKNIYKLATMIHIEENSRLYYNMISHLNNIDINLNFINNILNEFPNKNDIIDVLDILAFYKFNTDFNSVLNVLINSNLIKPILNKFTNLCSDNPESILKYILKYKNDIINDFSINLNKNTIILLIEDEHLKYLYKTNLPSEYHWFINQLN